MDQAGERRGGEDEDGQAENLESEVRDPPVEEESSCYEDWIFLKKSKDLRPI